MAAFAEARSALLALGARLGIDLTPDEHGVLTITVDDACLVTLELPPHRSHVCLHAPLARLSRERSPSVLIRALRLNLFAIDAPACWVALDEETSSLLLCGCIDAEDLSADRLAQTLTGFAAHVESARHRLQEQGDARPSTIPSGTTAIRV